MVAIKSLALLALAGIASADKLIKQLGVHRWVKPGEDAAAAPAPNYQPHNLSVPVDHFHNESQYAPHTDEYFNLRYYFDASHYKPGGPVIVLMGGETGVDDRLPFLEKGIVYELAKATNGVGVILEHRYYGTSFPPTNIVPDLSPKSLRFLTTAQSLADSNYFAQNVKFPGLEHIDLTAPNTPWIAYGGSYAGGYVAFLRTLYPGSYWGSLSSSGVTQAINDYWQYAQVIVNWGPRPCLTYLTKLTNMADNIFFHNGTYNQTLKEAFGVGQLKSNQDFTNILSTTMGTWQNRNWDPSINDPTFIHEWCAALTSPVADPSTVNQTATAKELLEAGGYGKEIGNLTIPLLNWIGYVKKTAVASCTGDQNQCFLVNNPQYYAQDGLDQWSWRSWNWQFCTQWGYFMPGSTVPKDQLPLISRLQDLAYANASCRLAFNITTPPDNQAVNQWGGYNIKAPRLAFIGGQADPWRDATPLAEWLWPKKSTPDEPAILIVTKDFGAVHHWDENGVFENVTNSTFPPPEVQAAKKTEADTVKRWLKEFKKQHKPADGEM